MRLLGFVRIVLLGLAALAIAVPALSTILSGKPETNFWQFLAICWLAISGNIRSIICAVSAR